MTPKGVVLVEETMPDHCPVELDDVVQLMFVLVVVNCEVSKVLPVLRFATPVKFVGVVGAVTSTEPLRRLFV